MPPIEIHLHPSLVHFPIALIITAFIFQLSGMIFRQDFLKRTALNIFIAACLIIPFAVWTGLEEAEELHLHHPVLDRHRLFALWALGVALSSLPVLWFVHRQKREYFSSFFLFLLLALTILVTLTAYNGGLLVYHYGVGIQP